MALWTYPFTICQCQLLGSVTPHYKTAVMTGLGRVFRADRDKLTPIQLCFISQHSKKGTPANITDAHCQGMIF